MSFFKYALIGVGLSVAVAGCGNQSSSSMSSNSSGSSTSSKTANQVVLSNGAFHPSKITITVGKTLTFIFDGMGRDHLDIVHQGHVIAHSPDLKKGGHWKYTFHAAGSFTIEPQTMTYIHGMIAVH